MGCPANFREENFVHHPYTHTRAHLHSFRPESMLNIVADFQLVGVQCSHQVLQHTNILLVRTAVARLDDE